RHIYTIGLEMGMPTGIIAKFGSMISEQNALMIATLLSPWGGIKMSHSDIVKLPTYFAEGIIPVMHGMPPYDYFAIKPKVGRIQMMQMTSRSPLTSTAFITPFTLAIRRRCGIRVGCTRSSTPCSQISTPAKSWVLSLMRVNSFAND
ncbi:MAG: hypothetical protein P8Y45_10760, partial [Exilibacterium sp.]